jgi:WS/DGAT/MGAT family acyltransferase
VRQLGWQDNFFLVMETPRTPAHASYVSICDPSTAPKGEVTFENVIDAFRRRLPLVPTFRRKLVRVPLGLDQAYWLEDADFDLEYHLRELALPRPGNWKQFCTQVARLHSRPLDLTRPPWECTMIEGLDAIDGIPAGSFALALKIHHAAIDGVAGVDMLNVLNDPAADTPPPEVEDTWRSEAVPSSAELLARAGVHVLTRPVHAARFAVTSAVPMARDALQRRRQDEPDPIEGLPHTRFNERVSPHRAFGAMRFPFEELRATRRPVPGATVNDAALTFIGAGMSRYLTEKGEAPDLPLVAVCPISIRPADSSGTLEGNQLSMMRTSLCTDIADPVARMAAIAKSTAATKAQQKGVGAEVLQEMSQALPGALMGLAMKAAARLPRTPTVANTMITNVPGPLEPYYCSGAQVLFGTGMGPVTDGLGLMHAVTTYGGLFECAVTSCREMIPDTEFYVQCLTDALDDLKKATRSGRYAGSA